MRNLGFAALAAGVLAVAGCGGGGKTGTTAQTTGRTGAVRSAIHRFVSMPHSPAAQDDRVVSVSISTLDPRYASARLDSKSAGPSEIVLHRGDGSWWVEQFGSSLSCAAAPRPVLAGLKVGCTPPAATAWVNDCGPLVAAPRSLILACADANLGLARLAWHGWGDATATGSGRVRANDCDPDCAGGRFHAYPATVSAAKLTACGRARYYARLEVRYAGRRPHGSKPREVYRLGC